MEFEWSSLTFRIWEYRSSILGSEASYPGREISCFDQSPQTSAGVVPFYILTIQSHPPLNYVVE